MERKRVIEGGCINTNGISRGDIVWRFGKGVKFVEMLRAE